MTNQVKTATLKLHNIKTHIKTELSWIEEIF